MYRERMQGYYPQVIGAIYEFNAIIDAEYPRIEAFRESEDDTLEDAWLLTMNEDRIEQWEKVFSITPRQTSTLSQRRDTIIARIRGQGKLNTALIKSIVSAFTGGTANTWIENSTLYVEITPPPGNKQYQFEDVEQELEHRIPTHISLQISRNYFEWGDIEDDFDSWGDMKDDLPTWEDVYLYVPFS